MTESSMFSSGLELGNSIASSDLLHRCWAAISNLHGEAGQNGPTSLPVIYRVRRQQPSGATIIGFACSPNRSAPYLRGEERDLISSENLKDIPIFEFLGTEANPSFSISKAAILLFASLKDELSHLKNQFGNTSPLIVTGHSLGGSVASLFTLWLLEGIPLTHERRLPLCITFGSPLLGDNGFQQAILERPKWSSCFCHVASIYDPMPNPFILPHNALALQFRSQISTYKPFGSFLLCSESGCACFEEPESVLNLMMATGSGSAGIQGPIDYGLILERLKLKTICSAISHPDARNLSQIQTGVIIELEEIGFGRVQHNGDMNSLVSIIVKAEENLIVQKREVVNPKRKINYMKINMTHLEWYKKVSMSYRGYYDSFKSVQSQAREEIVKRKNMLNKYWDKLVREAQKMPQKEGAFFRKCWLLGGTNYRRMVEPLEIADHYRRGKKGYLEKRPERYKLLEQWLEDYKSPGNQSRHQACSLTENSCFWAYIEEAIISCKLLKDAGSSPDVVELARVKLELLENDVMSWIAGYSVSTEIFLEGSSFMKWWADYEGIKGSSYNSSLTFYMRSGNYKQYK